MGHGLGGLLLFLFRSRSIQPGMGVFGFGYRSSNDKERGENREQKFE
jgi:hypothetical protein